MNFLETRRLANGTALLALIYWYGVLPRWFSLPAMVLVTYNLLTSIQARSSGTQKPFTIHYSPIKTRPSPVKSPQRTTGRLFDATQRSPSARSGIVSEGRGVASAPSSVPATPLVNLIRQRRQSTTSQSATPSPRKQQHPSHSQPQSTPQQVKLDIVSRSEQSSPTRFQSVRQPRSIQEVKELVEENISRQQQQQQLEALSGASGAASGLFQTPLRPSAPGGMAAQFVTGASPIQLKAFQPASKSPSQSKLLASKSPTKALSSEISGILSSNLITRSFEEFIAAYGFPSDTALMQSSRQLRQWFQDKIMQPVLDQYKAIITQQQQPPQSSTIQPSIFGIGSQQQQQQQLQQSIQDLEWMITIERQPASKEYVLHRIEQMVSSPQLGQYDWNHGSPVYQGKPFNPTQYPTDAEILFSLFCRFMDLKMTRAGNYRTTTPFTSTYVVMRNTEPGLSDTLPVPSTGNLRIFVSSQQPLHLSLLLERNVYDVYGGRNNLFYALISFLAFWNRKSAGWLETLSLGGDMDLLSILPPVEVDPVNEMIKSPQSKSSINRGFGNSLAASARQREE